MKFKVLRLDVCVSVEVVTTVKVGSVIFVVNVGL